jgi:uncharacterized protein (DUF2235 family)
VARNIILLSDGTGNSSGKLFKTNVWRVYQALDLSRHSQIAHYDDGIGTSAFKPLALIGGIFGWGLKRTVVDIYTFLCRNYVEGDQIYGFGFSRGAFTIRVLVKFILTQGLVNEYISDDDLKRKAVQLYREFRKERVTQFRVEIVVRGLRDSWLKTWNQFYRPFHERKISTRPVKSIKFLGLWDTVDAYGLPIEELEHGIDRYIWPLELKDEVLDRRIEKACHALSIDDQRTTFHPVLWDESDLDRFPEKNNTDDEVLTQVWFAGVHANIGGGYPDDGLSSVPLVWMVDEAIKKGLSFKGREVESLKAYVSPYGRVYNSRAAFGAYYRYDPRRLDPPRDRLGATILCPKVHESVIRRMAAGTDAYAPFNLPHNFRVVIGAASSRGTLSNATADAVAIEQNIYTFEDYVGTQGGTNGFDGHRSIHNATKLEDDFPEEVVDLSVLKQPEREALELIWDTVWWRKLAYFAAAAATFLLAGFPWLIEQFPKVSPSGLGELFRTPVIFAVNNIADFLPLFAKPWINAFESYPFSASYLVTIIILLLFWGRLLDRRIHNRAQAAWNKKWQESRYRWFCNSLRARIAWSAAATGGFGIYAIAALTLSANENNFHLLSSESRAFEAPVSAVVAVFSLIVLVDVMRLRRLGRELKRELPGRALRIAAVLRNSKLSMLFWKHFASDLIPAIFAGFVVVSAIAVINKFGFSFLEAGGWVCRRGATPLNHIPTEGIVVTFPADDGCFASGLALESGLRYRFKIAGVDTIHSDPSVAFKIESAPFAERQILRFGQTISRRLPPSLAHSFAMIPFRRILAEDWLTIIVRVGSSGNQEYSLGSRRWLEIGPTRDGELFVYTNSPVLGLPIIWNRFYAGNKGTVALQVEVVPNQ